MAQRYINPADVSNDCQFRVVSLVRRHEGHKTFSYMAVAVDQNLETLRFFQENMQEVIQNVKMVKRMEANDRYIEDLRRYATRGLPAE